ncbi:MAG TPA: hypothetical protein PKC30_01700 [Saprospiraceae bacterium]|nr:hypothetical protein [Saprospiraceae bacterium]
MKSILSIISIVLAIGVNVLSQVNTSEYFNRGKTKNFTESEIFTYATKYPNAKKGIFDDSKKLFPNAEFILYVESIEDVIRYLKQQEAFYKKEFLLDAFLKEVTSLTSINELIQLYEKYPFVLGGMEAEEYKSTISKLKNGEMTAFLDENKILVILDFEGESQENRDKLVSQSLLQGHKPLKSINK